MIHSTPDRHAPNAERVACFAMLSGGGQSLELLRRDQHGRWLKDFADPPAQAGELAGRRIVERQDVFVGVLPRMGRTSDAERRYVPTNVLWADVTPSAVRKLELFEPTPTAVVRSDGVDGKTPKLHAYWRLLAPLDADRSRAPAVLPARGDP